MNKREFLKSSSAILAGTALSGAGTFAKAQNLGYEELHTPLNISDPSKVQVLKFFWFGCPHCYAFEPTINKWDANKADYITLVREAPPLNPSWEAHSRTFYAAEAMGVKDQMFDETFNAIHKERRNLKSLDSLAKFMGTLGIDEDKFRETIGSFTVTSRMRRSIQLAQASRITGVPSLVVQGKYRTGNSLAGSHEGIIRVLDKLTAQEYELIQQAG